ncbi:MAG: hypothetical protein ACO3SO_05765, partial [Luteolibacter sp.]
QGGSMRLSVSMSKGGGGGLGKRTSPSHSPWSLRKNSTSPGLSMGRMTFMVLGQQGHFERITTPTVMDDLPQR